MRSFLLLLLLLLPLLASCSKAEAQPAGVSLARDWVLDESTAQPIPGGFITRSQADARYGRLAFANTWSAANTFNAAVALGNGADLTLGANSDLLFSGAITGSGAASITAGTGGLDTTGPSLATTYIRSRGTALGSFAACNSGVYGAAENDTTFDLWRQCNNGNLAASDAWRPIVQGGSGSTGWKQNTLLGVFRSGDIVSPEATDYMGMGVSGETDDNWNVLSGGAATISCSWETTGVVGGAATGVVMELTDGTNTCSCTLTGGATVCDDPIRANISCDCTWSGTVGARVGNLTAGNKGIHLQMKNTTDCGTNPRNVQCTAYSLFGPL